MTGRSSVTPAFISAALVGAAGGWLLARRHDRTHRHDLFSPRAYRRFAALGWIATEADAGSVAVLHDYVAWETQPALRRRGLRIIAALEGRA
jgi:uncharacterized protein (TIGR03382 family)